MRWNRPHPKSPPRNRSPSPRYLPVWQPKTATSEENLIELAGRAARFESAGRQGRCGEWLARVGDGAEPLARRPLLSGDRDLLAGAPDEVPPHHDLLVERF